jgi:hypothetical protein
MHRQPYYTLGLDLGRSQDPTALALIESHPGESIFRLRGLHRFPLGTPNTELIALLERRLTTKPLAGRVRLAVDATGIGGAFVDLFHQKLPQIDLFAITITAGTAVGGDRKNPHVPKYDLIASTSVILETGRLRIANDMRETTTLRDELLSFRSTRTEHGNYTYGARSGQHDDLVLALSLALWLLQHRRLRNPNQRNIAWDKGEIPGIVPSGARFISS